MCSITELCIWLRNRSVSKVRVDWPRSSDDTTADPALLPCVVQLVVTEPWRQSAASAEQRGMWTRTPNSLHSVYDVYRVNRRVAAAGPISYNHKHRIPRQSNISIVDQLCFVSLQVIAWY